MRLCFRDRDSNRSRRIWDKKADDKIGSKAAGFGDLTLYPIPVLRFVDIAKGSNDRNSLLPFFPNILLDFFFSDAMMFSTPPDFMRSKDQNVLLFRPVTPK